MPDLALRYARAVSSTALRVQADVDGDCDLLIASGWSGASSSLASLVLRARAEHDRGAAGRSATRAATTAVGDFIRRQALLSGIDLPHAVLQRTTHAVMAALLKPSCPACRGVAFRLIAGTPRLSDEVCPACTGTGRRQIDLQSEDQADLIDRVLALIEAKVQAHAAKMARYLRS